MEAWDPVEKILIYFLFENDLSLFVFNFELALLLYLYCMNSLVMTEIAWVMRTWVKLDLFSNHYWRTFSSVQSLCCVQFFVTPWTAAHQASLSITNSQNLLNIVSIESVMLSNHLIICHPLLLPPSIFPSIRVFSNESALRIRWSKYWSFSFSISPSIEYSGLISFRMDWLDRFTFQGTQVSSSTPQFKSINSSVLSFLYSPTLTSTHKSWENHSVD